MSGIFEKEKIEITRREFDSLIDAKSKLMAIEAVVSTSAYPDKQVAKILGIELEDE